MAIAASAAEAGDRAGVPAREHLRVLVVDDDRDEVAVLMALMRDEGHETRGEYRGSVVLDAVRDFDPHVVLLDIGLPDASGYDVARGICERFGKDRPLLIAVTGWKKAADRLASQLAGFDHHVAKPYDPSALLKLLRAGAPG